jgi:hypothetical protein
MDVENGRYIPGNQNRGSAAFKDKVQQLSAAIDEGTRKVSLKDQCFPTVVGIGVVVPFGTMLVLFLTRPYFVRKYEGNKSTLNVKRLFWYSMGITLLIWGMMYLFNLFKGFDRLAMMCVV